MSHLRNRHIKTSAYLHSENKFSIRNRNATPQLNRNLHTAERIKTQPDLHMKSLYNQNISHFRPCFDQNDTSQLPFMATLRSYSLNKKQPKATISQPFEASYKTTCNQKHKRKISDFQTKAARLAFASYRWHNKTGRGSLWATDFQCSLRKYQEIKARQSQYYSYVKPINYKNAQERVYDRSEMVCDHFYKSFKIKENKPK